MAANTTSLGDHMYTVLGARVLTIPSSAVATQVYVANRTSIAVLAGKVLRGATLSGVLRNVLPGMVVSIRWNGIDAVLGAEAPDGGGRVQVPFSITLAQRGAPYMLYASAPNEVNSGMLVSIIHPDNGTIPAGAYVTVHSSTIYYSAKPSFSLEVPEEVAVGEEVEAVLRVQYLGGDLVDGQRVTMRNSTGAVGLSFNGSPAANEIALTSDGSGEIRFALVGARAAGDAISVTAATPALFSPELNVVVPINGSGVEGSCVVVPASPAVPSTPGYIVYTPQFAWDAGARSVEQLDGDVELSFTMETVVGVVVGLCVAGAATVGAREEISHGLYMFTDGGRVRQFQVYERGERLGVVASYADTDTFYIRRIGGRVIYILEDAGTVLFRYASNTPLEGPVEVLSALYASGDFIPGGEITPPDPDPYAFTSSGSGSGGGMLTYDSWTGAPPDLVSDALNSAVVGGVEEVTVLARILEYRDASDALIDISATPTDGVFDTDSGDYCIRFYQADLLALGWAINDARGVTVEFLDAFGTPLGTAYGSLICAGGI